MARRGNSSEAGGGLPYSQDEIQAFILPLYMKGLTASAICVQARERLGIDLPQAAVKHEVRQARMQRRLRYEPGRDPVLAGRLEDFVSGRGLPPVTADVIATTEAADVARAAAERLCRLVSAAFRDDPARDELHIGFAGGHSPCLMAKALAEMLADPTRWDLPPGCRRRLVFHSVVGHMNPSNPEADPNAFFIYLAARRGLGLPFDLRFNSLPAPGVVTRDEHRRLTGGDGGGGFGLVRAALRGRDRLDVIVFSCGHWGPGHQSVHDYLVEACHPDDALRSGWEAMATRLAEVGIVGDVMWTPIHPERALLHLHREVRLLGLVEDIFDLVRFANAAGTRHAALLLAGPCSGPECRQSKGTILAALLRRMPRLPMTHLVVDSRSARDCLAILAPEPAAAPPRHTGGRGRGRAATADDGPQLTA